MKEITIKDLLENAQVNLDAAIAVVSNVQDTIEDNGEDAESLQLIAALNVLHSISDDLEAVVNVMIDNADNHQGATTKRAYFSKALIDSLPELSEGHIIYLYELTMRLLDRKK